MLTVEQIIEYIEHTIAEDRLTGEIVNLKQLQTTAGILMLAAEKHGDKQTAYRFRVLAAQAANKREELESQ
jgi:hypothetical protein